MTTKSQMTSGAAAPASLVKSIDWSTIAARYGTVAAALVIFAGFAIATDRFLSLNNISNILIQISVLMIISSGLTFAVASGEFDLSVGQVASLSGVLVAGLMIWSGLPVAAAIALAVASGVVIGVVNGMLVTRLRIPSLIATLAMGPIALGVNYAYTSGDSIYASMPPSFYYIATGKVGIVPVPVIIALLIVGVFYILLNKTRLGRGVVATGRTFRPPVFQAFRSIAAGRSRSRFPASAPRWAA